MRVYYKGPLNIATISINDGKVERNDSTINENELFYENAFGVLIRDNNDMPIILYDEVEDYIDSIKLSVSSFHSDFLYTNPDELECIRQKPEEAISMSIPEKVKTYVKSRFNGNKN